MKYFHIVATILMMLGSLSAHSAAIPVGADISVGSGLNPNNFSGDIFLGDTGGGVAGLRITQTGGAKLDVVSFQVQARDNLATVSTLQTFEDVQSGSSFVVAVSENQDYILGLSAAVSGNNGLRTFQVEALTAVPIPAAAWLFGTAVLGLGFVKRRRDG